MGKWTPGKWGVEQTPERNWIGPMRSDGRKINEIVCSTDREGLREDAVAENDANARLIAAAPELAEALKLWARWNEMTEAELALALEATTTALAKAGAV